MCADSLLYVRQGGDLCVCVCVCVTQVADLLSPSGELLLMTVTENDPLGETHTHTRAHILDILCLVLQNWCQCK